MFLRGSHKSDINTIIRHCSYADHSGFRAASEGPRSGPHQGHGPDTGKGPIDTDAHTDTDAEESIIIDNPFNPRPIKDAVALSSSINGFKYIILYR